MSPYRRGRTKSRKPKTPLKWLAIIMLVAGLLAFILGWGGGAIEFIEHYFQYRDDSYRPMDLERATQERTP